MTMSGEAPPFAFGSVRSGDELAHLDRRLRLIEGQARGVRRMLQEHRRCDEVLAQLLATSRAIDAVRFRLVALQLCEAAGPAATADPHRVSELERLLRAAR